jgi:hypothetical protein
MSFFFKKNFGSLVSFMKQKQKLAFKIRATLSLLWENLFSLLVVSLALLSIVSFLNC